MPIGNFRKRSGIYKTETMSAWQSYKANGSCARRHLRKEEIEKMNARNLLVISLLVALLAAACSPAATPQPSVGTVGAEAPPPSAGQPAQVAPAYPAPAPTQPPAFVAPQPPADRSRSAES